MGSGPYSPTYMLQSVGSGRSSVGFSLRVLALQSVSPTNLVSAPRFARNTIYTNMYNIEGLLGRKY